MKKEDEGEEEEDEAEEEEEDEQQVDAVLLLDLEPISRSVVSSSKISVAGHTRGLYSRVDGPGSLRLSDKPSFRDPV